MGALGERAALICFLSLSLLSMPATTVSIRIAFTLFSEIKLFTITGEIWHVN